MRYVVGVVVAAIAALFGTASRRPDTFGVSRSTAVGASPEQIFPLINDFHQWVRWSPFDKLDPAMTKTFSGPDQGVGAGYSWVGNRKAGAGSMKIIGSVPSSSVSIAMEFLKPFKSHSTVNFTMEPVGADTSVTWAMVGKSHIMSKVMGVFVSMDRLIGKDFAEGLANLKREAESATE